MVGQVGRGAGRWRERMKVFEICGRGVASIGCSSHMFQPHVPAACSRGMFPRHTLAAWPCGMFQLLGLQSVPAECVGGMTEVKWPQLEWPGRDKRRSGLWRRQRCLDWGQVAGAAGRMSP